MPNTQVSIDFKNVFDAIDKTDVVALKDLLDVNQLEFIEKTLIDDNTIAFALLLDLRKKQLHEQLQNGEFTLLIQSLQYGALDCEKMCREFIKRYRY